MCGIAGVLHFDRHHTVDPLLLGRMGAAIGHRGPDDAGVYHEGPVGLVSRRLAIIDLSANGHQPMSTANGRYWITYNGEIYNYQALRDVLARGGATFRSASDTEVILHLYEREGAACLRHLRGMFALAIWDTRDRTLFVARDRLGKKPLHYYVDHERFVFASEPKAITEDPAVPAEADLESIYEYLSFGYVPSPRSAFKGFHKLPPAHWLLVKDGELRVERYWRLPYGPKLEGTEAELADRLLAELREAVRLRMIADVPVGAFLSGGIDSSAVVALMSEASSRPVRTFSIGFEEDAYNELPFARLVAERYRTDHHEFVVKPDAVDVLPELVWHYNEPYADSSAVPTYYLSKLTRQHVTVALNGDAGDENFAGYDRYLATVLARRYDHVPAPLRRLLGAVAGRLPRMGGPRSLPRRVQRFAETAGAAPHRRYGRWVGLFDDAEKTTLCTPELARAAARPDSLARLLDAYAATETDDVVDATLGMDVATYLLDDLLVKVDIASMANSLEARSPMVDHVFMEFAAALPSSLKLRGRTKKYLLKRAVAPLLPAAVVDRPKQGFGVPLDAWFRHELKDLAHDTLLGPRARARGLLEPAAVRRLLDEHVSGRRTWDRQLWGLLFLELWFQRFIDGRRSA
jgi:asparagine synthase (glutamine-hydrolysing)